MTPDKEHTPALMQQAADEAVALFDPSIEAQHNDLYDEWLAERGIVTERAKMKDTIVSLDAQLAAAERERDAQYEENVARIAAEGAAILRARTSGTGCMRSPSIRGKARSPICQNGRASVPATFKTGSRKSPSAPLPRSLQMPNDELMGPLGNITSITATAEKMAERMGKRFVVDDEKLQRLLDPQHVANPRSAPTYEQGVAAGLEMAAKVADDLCMDASGFTEEEHAYGAVAKAIRALADQHKPSPAEEPMP